MTLEPEPEPQPDIDIYAVVTAWERADAEAEIQADHWTEVTFDGPDPGICAEAQIDDEELEL